MSALTPTQKINLVNGGALVTIKSDKTHRARKMLHKADHHHLCSWACSKKASA